MVTNDALAFLQAEVGKREVGAPMNFQDYLAVVQKEPQRVLRNIFQLFYDAVKTHVTREEDEYPDDPESIGFVKYDCSKLFVEGSDSPFFVDRLFANRFMRQVESLRHGFQQNRIYAYDGPSGCGKSTFLNNLLRAFEAYTYTREGQTFELIWEIDESLFCESSKDSEKKPLLVIPCPSHDYPILLIPKDQRLGFLQRLFADRPEDLKAILNEKSYDWLMSGDVCTICKSIFWASLEKLGSLEQVLRMVRVRPYRFNRALGEGISIFNPGDRPMMQMAGGEPSGWYFANQQIQERLDSIFGINVVRYKSSLLARTNNGIYVLMDVKSHNRGRLLELHNVISEGVHKVGGDVEEHINSLFLALMNPEDQGVFKEEKMESFEGRIHYNKIPFVLEPATEIEIWHSIFGQGIDGRFLPEVLLGLAAVIICSRMNKECGPFKEWIPDMKQYARYCDEYGILLRMAIYSGIIPDWLSEEDRKKFTAAMRRAIITEGEHEGAAGFSGRDSIVLFREFFSLYGGRENLITMANVIDFFKHKISRDTRNTNIPPKFLASLQDSYDYGVLNAVKESLYYYNEDQIERDVLNYLCAVDYDPGSDITCSYTGEELYVTIDFLKLVGSRLTGKSMSDAEALRFAQDIQKKHTTTRAKEGLGITETDFYKELLKTYRKNLQANVLQPFIASSSFRDAVKAFGTPDFETFDTRLREHIAYMVTNLTERFCYTEQGAKEICIYVLDKNLAQQFA